MAEPVRPDGTAALWDVNATVDGVLPPTTKSEANTLLRNALVVLQEPGVPSLSAFRACSASSWVTSNANGAKALGLSAASQPAAKSRTIDLKPFLAGQRFTPPVPAGLAGAGGPHDFLLYGLAAPIFSSPFPTCMQEQPALRNLQEPAIVKIIRGFFDQPFPWHSRDSFVRFDVAEGDD